MKKRSTSKHGKRRIIRASFRTKKGKVIRARDYGKKGFVFWVKR